MHMYIHCGSFSLELVVLHQKRAQSLPEGAALLSGCMQFVSWLFLMFSSDCRCTTSVGCSVLLLD